MFKVYGNKLTIEDRKLLKKILGLAGIKDNAFSIHDVNSEDVNFVPGNDQLLTVGKDATRRVVKILVNMKVISSVTFLGNDLVDSDNLFFMYHIPDISVFSASQEQKDYVWNKILAIKALLDEWFPFDDDISSVHEVVDNIESSTMQVEDSVSTPVEQIVADSPSSQEQNVTESTIERKIDSISVDVLDIINALFEQINLSDPNLGNTLAKYESFSFTSGNNVVNVYPSGRIPSSDHYGINLKDFLVVLKSAVLFGSNNVIMRKNDQSVTE